MSDYPEGAALDMQGFEDEIMDLLTDLVKSAPTIWAMRASTLLRDMDAA